MILKRFLCWFLIIVFAVFFLDRSRFIYAEESKSVDDLLTLGSLGQPQWKIHKSINIIEIIEMAIDKDSNFLDKFFILFGNINKCINVMCCWEEMNMAFSNGSFSHLSLLEFTIFIMNIK